MQEGPLHVALNNKHERDAAGKSHCEHVCEYICTSD